MANASFAVCKLRQAISQSEFRTGTVEVYVLCFVLLNSQNVFFVFLLSSTFAMCEVNKIC